jgi:acyl-CoA thioester hydrolase
MYEKTMEVRWADLDPNRHLRHSAYPDYATHIRFSYLVDHGYHPSRFAELNYGPVILKETTTFLKEVGPGERITMDFRMSGMARDCSRFRMNHRAHRSDGVLAAVVEVEGAWMDLATRKLRPPEPALAELLGALPRTDDFEELQSLG